MLLLLFFFFFLFFLYFVVVLWFLLVWVCGGSGARVLAGQRRFVFVVVNIVVAWSIRLGRSVSAFFDDRLRAVAGRWASRAHEISCGIFAFFLFWANRSNPSWIRPHFLPDSLLNYIQMEQNHHLCVLRCRAVILASWGCGNMRILRQLGKKGSCDMCVWQGAGVFWAHGLCGHC